VRLLTLHLCCLLQDPRSTLDCGVSVFRPSFTVEVPRGGAMSNLVLVVSPPRTKRTRTRDNYRLTASTSLRASVKSPLIKSSTTTKSTFPLYFSKTGRARADSPLLDDRAVPRTFHPFSRNLIAVWTATKPLIPVMRTVGISVTCGAGVYD
jgi:hypothetical protein